MRWFRDNVTETVRHQSVGLHQQLFAGGEGWEGGGGGGEQENNICGGGHPLRISIVFFLFQDINVFEHNHFEIDGKYTAHFIQVRTSSKRLRTRQSNARQWTT